MTQVFISLIFFLCIIYKSKSASCDVGYFWRQFTGTIPKDAFIAGKNIDKKNIYVGRAFAPNGGGVFPTEITAEKTEFHIIFMEIPKTTQFVEILCGFQDDFKWMPANSTHLHITLKHKELVIGGYHDGRGFMNIGRIHLNGETKVGKVDSFRVGDAIFFCITRDVTDATATSYEVLVYERTFTLLQLTDE